MLVKDNPFETETIDLQNENAPKRVGYRIRTARLARGMNQAELGDLVNLNSDRIQKYENGVRSPRPELLRQIADALEVNVLALTDPVISSYMNIMYGLFELENYYGIKLEKGDMKYCLTIDSENGLYKYLEDWYQEYDSIQLSLRAASTEQEQEEVMERYLDWKRNYPNGVSESEVKKVQKQKIRDQIEALQEQLNRLESVGE